MRNIEEVKRRSGVACGGSVEGAVHSPTPQGATCAHQLLKKLSLLICWVPCRSYSQSSATCIG